MLIEVNELITVDWHEKALQELLYGIEKLRKQANES
jgi:hypothetical protein